jgi:RNA polymerase sigma-70 factor (ECF subfamily)
MASFLHRAAINAALDLMRSRQNVRHIPLDELEPVLAEPAHRSPERARSSGEIRDWLRGALARLNPRIAQMFTLRFFEGKDNPEIARLLETTPGTVAVTLSRTRDKLEKEYRAYMGGVA